MKSNLLFLTVALAGLAGLTSAQSYERRVPGFNGYGSRERPGVTVNVVTAAQLTQWMQASSGSRTATADSGVMPSANWWRVATLVRLPRISALPEGSECDCGRSNRPEQSSRVSDGR